MKRLTVLNAFAVLAAHFTRRRVFGRALAAALTLPAAGWVLSTPAQARGLSATDRLNCEMQVQLGSPSANCVAHGYRVNAAASPPATSSNTYSYPGYTAPAANVAYQTPAYAAQAHAQPSAVQPGSLVSAAASSRSYQDTSYAAAPFNNQAAQQPRTRVTGVLSRTDIPAIEPKSTVIVFYHNGAWKEYAQTSSAYGTAEIAYQATSGGWQQISLDALGVSKHQLAALAKQSNSPYMQLSQADVEKLQQPAVNNPTANQQASLGLATDTVPAESYVASGYTGGGSMAACIADLKKTAAPYGFIRDHHIIAMAASFMGESSCNPHQAELKGNDFFGAAQWDHQRQENFQAWHSRGYSMRDPRVTFEDQAAFSWYEMFGTGGQLHEAGQKLLGTRDVVSAVRVVVLDYEVVAKKVRQRALNERTAIALNAMNNMRIVNARSYVRTSAVTSPPASAAPMHVAAQFKNLTPQRRAFAQIDKTASSFTAKIAQAEIPMVTQMPKKIIGFDVG